jgi:hypothetical protein
VIAESPTLKLDIHSKCVDLYLHGMTTHISNFCGSDMDTRENPHHSCIQENFEVSEYCIQRKIDGKHLQPTGARDTATHVVGRLLSGVPFQYCRHFSMQPGRLSCRVVELNVDQYETID